MLLATRSDRVSCVMPTHTPQTTASAEDQQATARATTQAQMPGSEQWTAFLLIVGGSASVCLFWRANAAQRFSLTQGKWANQKRSRRKNQRENSQQAEAKQASS
eukprot:m.266664 g.266664  ORF g.266664 m.266664 type:complete len:104 (-) comp19278_c0_seq2:288-599(-)